MRLKLTALLLAALTAASRADPIAIVATPLATFATASSATDFGPLSWRGGLVLSSPDEKFGGLSGLALSADCTRLIAVSDAGRWFGATLAYDGEKLGGLGDPELASILDDKGNPLKSKTRADAEAIANLGRGRYMVAFERRPRIGIYDIGKSGFTARFKLLKSPKAITEGPRNGEVEALGRLSHGPWTDHYLAISEKHVDSRGNTRGWLWQSWKTVPFAVKRLEDYDITDAATLPGGDVLLLERSFGAASLPGMAIRRFASSAITDGATVEPELLFAGRVPFFAIDNMEGIALCARDGETRIAIVSDNNFDTARQRTLLLQFAYDY